MKDYWENNWRYNKKLAVAIGFLTLLSLMWYWWIGLIFIGLVFVALIFID